MPKSAKPSSRKGKKEKDGKEKDGKDSVKDKENTATEVSKVCTGRESGEIFWCNSQYQESFQEATLGTKREGKTEADGTKEVTASEAEPSEIGYEYTDG